MSAFPKFRPDLEAYDQQDVTGHKIVLLKDPVSEKYFRVSDYEYRLLKTLDGTVGVDEAIERLKARGYYYSSGEGSQIVTRAAYSGLLLGTLFGTAKFLKAAKERIKQLKKARLLSSVYFLFIPLVNPDKFLERTVGYFRLVYNKWTGLLVVLAFPGAMYLVISSIPRIHGELLFFFNLTNLLYLWVTIAVTKLVHELSHAYTAKRYGLHVPGMGIVFLIFFPCLFCNTTDAWQLADRKQRMAISAAGVGSEFALAIVATYVWYFSGPSVVNSVAFYMMGISFFSTVLVNGNPLMKFDGYFILVDYLGIPNLYQKSFAYLRYLVMNRVLGVDTVFDPSRRPRERLIFSVYGAASFVYRIVLYTGIVAAVYYKFDKTLGILLGGLAFGLFLVTPVFKSLNSLYRQSSQVRPRVSGAVILSALLGIAGTVLFVPFSGNSVYPCYLDSVKKQKLTVPLHTWVADVFVREGMSVTKGTVLFELDTSLLELRLLKKECDRDIIKAELALLQLEDERRGEIPGKEIELRQAEDEIRLVRQRLSEAKSGITAPFDGIVTRLDPEMKRGFQPGEGVVVGELESPQHCAIRALVPETDVHKIKVGQEIRFRLGGDRTEHKAAIDEIRPFSEQDLNSSPFSSRLGGELATEVKGQKHKDSPLEAQFDCSAPFTNSEPRMPLGMTGRLVVPGQPRSLAGRLLDALAQTFNRESLL